MNYRTASKQQLLAERARLANAHRKAEQRLGPGASAGAVGGGGSRRSRASTHQPKREVDQLAEQLALVEAELKRREEQAVQPGVPAGDEPVVEA